MKIMVTMLTMLTAILLCACTPGAEEPSPRPPVENPGGNPDTPSQTTRTMNITIGATLFSATLADNATAASFRAMLPMTVAMSEHNGNEKYHYLPGTLPAAPSNPGTIRSGDLMLYGSDCLVLFYKTFSTSYSYTRIGRIDDPSGLEAALGGGGVTVKFELTNE